MAFYSAHLGINYAGTQHELGGCLADADELAKLFAPLVKSAGGVIDKMFEREATLEGVRDFLRENLRRLKAGDTLFVSRSGHGTQVRDRDGDEADKQDECFVCYDLRLMSDDEFAVLLTQRASGSVVVVFDDCCHSGGGSRLFSEPYKPFPGPGVLSPGAVLRDKPRFIPGSQLTARPAKFDRRNAPGQPGADGVLHIAACRPNEVAWDTGRHGAATLALLAALKQVAMASKPQKWDDVFTYVSAQLPTKQHPQTPTITGDDWVAKQMLPWLAKTQATLPPQGVLELGVSGVTAPDVLRFNGRTYRAE